MATIKRVKNNFRNPKIYNGVIIQPGEYHTIHPSEYSAWSEDDQLLKDIALGEAIVNDGQKDIVGISEQINFLKNIQPTDADGCPIIRSKATRAGWHYQYHAVNFTTSVINGFFNKSINPLTKATTNLGFVQYRLYNSQNQLITTQEKADAEAVFTEIDWTVNHEMEILGGNFFQNKNPDVDIYMWIFAAPGIANIPFGQGGLNLKHISNGAVAEADGKTPKYMHPTKPVQGVNRFRMILNHPPGYKHEGMMVFTLFKP